MKVAVLFFGQPRFLDNPEPIKSHVDHVLSKYDCDSFVHTWWEQDLGNYEASSWSKIGNVPPDNDAIAKIQKMYNPKAIKYEAPHKFELGPATKEIMSRFDWAINNGHNIVSQLYSFTEVAKLAKQYAKIRNVKYDFILATRTDNRILKFPDLNSLPKEKFFLSNHHDNFPDTIFLFDAKFLDFMEIYDNIEEISGKLWNPTVELYKRQNFIDKFNAADITPIGDLFSDFVRTN